MKRGQKICAFIEAYRIISKDIKVVQPMRYVREPDVITAASKVTTRIRTFMRGNSSGRRLRLLGVAMDGAGVR